MKDATIGYEYKDGSSKPVIGTDCVFRAGTIIYNDVEIGNNVQTGHNALIREKTKIGSNVVIGTNTVIDGNVDIADFVSIQTNVYIPTHTKIEKFVFIGPGAVLTNDQYPLKDRANYVPQGPTLREGVTIGGGVVICPDVEIGAGSFVAAGAVVTKDIPPNSFAVGVPAVIKPLPEKLREKNMAKSWQKILAAEKSSAA